MLNLLIGPIAEIAGTWMSGKVEQTKANAQTKVAKAQAEAVVMQKKATGEIDWDLEMDGLGPKKKNWTHTRLEEKMRPEI